MTLGETAGGFDVSPVRPDCRPAVVFVDLVTSYLTGYGALADATWIVGTTLVAAFLFNTAVAIRQQGGELERLYDWTTWREQTFDDRLTE